MTENELGYYRKLKPRLGIGDLAVTSGGATESRFIIHAAVIDLNNNLYPDQNVIRKIVRRTLLCAASFGARSVSFPVLGGGTASKHLSASDIIRVIVSEFIVFAEQYQETFDGAVNNIGLYVFDQGDIPPDLEALFSPLPQNKDGG
jgi:O-acetyl-ADP-ribose deacetylase (regulator of RNase III)